MRKTMLATAAATLTVCSAALAQSTIIVDPAPTGSIVLPGEVRTYVMEQQVPSVVYEGDVVVGTTLPETVEIHEVPEMDGYAYTVVNNRRVIVEPQTHRVIQILE
ncbi:hypothetical protein AM571_CH01392 [Rhizobium etli 8C-3]|uniref:Uncharacterized protein DUF1236 n=2 Tax=Rhizobium TaxID=379 RepID=A0A4R3QP32_9HYPH|nr:MULTISPECIES: DUF1236 domain-containing protein [Rhizobium]APO74228.1 hypothetical protein AM571_CH01392 [Rhizobium etli 8C-3]TCU23034.1 uncharacterized protein DUF1236 [Rhizobium azibense]TCU36612.1 uncharacterized protein DUF1236 [Rhizobium azibense]